MDGFAQLFTKSTFFLASCMEDDPPIDRFTTLSKHVTNDYMDGVLSTFEGLHYMAEIRSESGRKCTIEYTHIKNVVTLLLEHIYEQQFGKPTLALLRALSKELKIIPGVVFRVGICNTSHGSSQ